MEAPQPAGWIMRRLHYHTNTLAIGGVLFGVAVVAAYLAWLRTNPVEQVELQLARIADAENAALCTELGVPAARNEACRARLREVQSEQLQRWQAAFGRY